MGSTRQTRSRVGDSHTVASDQVTDDYGDSDQKKHEESDDDPLSGHGARMMPNGPSSATRHEAHGLQK
jgi:hypothetical protein